MTTGRTREPIRWSPEKIARFAARWNAGEDATVLREIYGRPASLIARHLRAVHGIALVDRRPGRNKH